MAASLQFPNQRPAHMFACIAEIVNLTGTARLQGCRADCHFEKDNGSCHSIDRKNDADTLIRFNSYRRRPHHMRIDGQEGGPSASGSRFLIE